MEYCVELDEIEQRYLSSLEGEGHFKIDKEYRAHLEAQIEEDPGNVHALVPLAVLLWGPFQDEQGAIATLLKAIQSEPGSVEAYFWLAKFYTELGFYKEAKQAVMNALRLEPQRADCLAVLGEILENSSESLEEALICFEKAVEHAPDWPALWLSLGLLYLKQGQTKYAEEHFKMVGELASNPIRKTRNGVEKYYELMITGRGNEHILEKMNYWKYRVLKSSAFVAGDVQTPKESKGCKHSFKNKC